MTFRRISAFLIATGLMMSQLSCTPSNHAQSDTKKQTISQTSTLSFRITWKDYSGRGQAIQKIVDQYNQLFADDATIQLISGDEDLAAIQTLLEEDSETVFVLPYRYVRYFGNLGLLTDLTSDFNEEKSAFYPEVWALGTTNGNTYGIPWLGHTMCLLYNESLLAAAGVNPESIIDLDSFVSALTAVEEKTSARGIGLVGADSNDISWMVNQFIYGFGGKLVNQTGDKVLINTRESTDAINFYKNVLGAHAQSTWTQDTGTEVMKYFLNQEVAFEIQGIWGISDVQKNGAPFEVGVIPLKQIGVCSEIGPMMLATPKNMSEQAKQQSIAFIHYMISIDAQQAILNGEYSPEHDAYYPFRTPIRKDMANTQMMKMYPVYQVFIEGFENPSIDVPVPAWQPIKKEFYEPGLHSVMIGAISAETFLKMIETEGNKTLSAN